MFWIADPIAIWICLAIALLLFFTAHRVQRRYPVLLWADAVGISLYGVMGAELARQSGAGPLVAIVMGMMTATFGGLLRDVVCGEMTLVLRKEVYVTAAALAAAMHIGISALGVSTEISMMVGMAAGFSLRALGIVKGLSLPSYKARPGREY